MSTKSLNRYLQQIYDLLRESTGEKLRLAGQLSSYVNDFLPQIYDIESIAHELLTKINHEYTALGMEADYLRELIDFQTDNIHNADVLAAFEVLVGKQGEPFTQEERTTIYLRELQVCATLLTILLQYINQLKFPSVLFQRLLYINVGFNTNMNNLSEFFNSFLLQSYPLLGESDDDDAAAADTDDENGRGGIDQVNRQNAIVSITSPPSGGIGDDGTIMSVCSNNTIGNTNSPVYLDSDHHSLNTTTLSIVNTTDSTYTNLDSMMMTMKGINNNNNNNNNNNIPHINSNQSTRVNNNNNNKSKTTQHINGIITPEIKLYLEHCAELVSFLSFVLYRSYDNSLVYKGETGENQLLSLQLAFDSEFHFHQEQEMIEMKLLNERKIQQQKQLSSSPPPPNQTAPSQRIINNPTDDKNNNNLHHQHAQSEVMSHHSNDSTEGINDNVNFDSLSVRFDPTRHDNTDSQSLYTQSLNIPAATWAISPHKQSNLPPSTQPNNNNNNIDTATTITTTTLPLLNDSTAPQIMKQSEPTNDNITLDDSGIIHPEVKFIDLIKEHFMQLDAVFEAIDYLCHEQYLNEPSVLNYFKISHRMKYEEEMRQIEEAKEKLGDQMEKEKRIHQGNQDDDGDNDIDPELKALEKRAQYWQDAEAERNEREVVTNPEALASRKRLVGLWKKQQEMDEKRDAFLRYRDAKLAKQQQANKNTPNTSTTAMLLGNGNKNNTNILSSLLTTTTTTPSTNKNTTKNQLNDNGDDDYDDDYDPDEARDVVDEEKILEDEFNALLRDMSPEDMKTFQQSLFPSSSSTPTSIFDENGSLSLTNLINTSAAYDQNIKDNNNTKNDLMAGLDDLMSQFEEQEKLAQDEMDSISVVGDDRDADFSQRVYSPSNRPGSMFGQGPNNNNNDNDDMSDTSSQYTWTYTYTYAYTDATTIPFPAQNSQDNENKQDLGQFEITSIFTNYSDDDQAVQKHSEKTLALVQKKVELYPQQLAFSNQRFVSKIKEIEQRLDSKEANKGNTTIMTSDDAMIDQGPKVLSIDIPDPENDDHEANIHVGKTNHIEVDANTLFPTTTNTNQFDINTNTTTAAAGQGNLESILTLFSIMRRSLFHCYQYGLLPFYLEDAMMGSINQMDKGQFKKQHGIVIEEVSDEEDDEDDEDEDEWTDDDDNDIAPETQHLSAKNHVMHQGGPTNPETIEYMEIMKQEREKFHKKHPKHNNNNNDIVPNVITANDKYKISQVSETPSDDEVFGGFRSLQEERMAKYLDDTPTPTKVSELLREILSIDIIDNFELDSFRIYELRGLLYQVFSELKMINDNNKILMAKQLEEQNKKHYLSSVLSKYTNAPSSQDHHDNLSNAESITPLGSIFGQTIGLGSDGINSPLEVQSLYQPLLTSPNKVQDGHVVQNNNNNNNQNNTNTTVSVNALPIAFNSFEIDLRIKGAADDDRFDNHDHDNDDNDDGDDHTMNFHHTNSDSLRDSHHGSYHGSSPNASFTSDLPHSPNLDTKSLHNTKLMTSFTKQRQSELLSRQGQDIVIDKSLVGGGGGGGNHAILQPMPNQSALSVGGRYVQPSYSLRPINPLQQQQQQQSLTTVKSYIAPLSTTASMNVMNTTTPPLGTNQLDNQTDVTMPITQESLKINQDNTSLSNLILGAPVVYNNKNNNHDDNFNNDNEECLSLREDEKHDAISISNLAIGDKNNYNHLDSVESLHAEDDDLRSIHSQQNLDDYKALSMQQHQASKFIYNLNNLQNDHQRQKSKNVHFFENVESKNSNKNVPTVALSMVGGMLPRSLQNTGLNEGNNKVDVSSSTIPEQDHFVRVDDQTTTDTNSSHINNNNTKNNVDSILPCVTHNNISTFSSVGSIGSNTSMDENALVPSSTQTPFGEGRSLNTAALSVVSEPAPLGEFSGDMKKDHKRIGNNVSNLPQNRSGKNTTTTATTSTNSQQSGPTIKWVDFSGFDLLLHNSPDDENEHVTVDYVDNQLDHIDSTTNSQQNNISDDEGNNDNTNKTGNNNNNNNNNTNNDNNNDDSNQNNDNVANDTPLLNNNDDNEENRMATVDENSMVEVEERYQSQDSMCTNESIHPPTDTSRQLDISTTVSSSLLGDNMSSTVVLPTDSQQLFSPSSSYRTLPIGGHMLSMNTNNNNNNNNNNVPKMISSSHSVKGDQIRSRPLPHPTTPLHTYTTIPGLTSPSIPEHEEILDLPQYLSRTSLGGGGGVGVGGRSSHGFEDNNYPHHPSQQSQLLSQSLSMTGQQFSHHHPNNHQSRLNHHNMNRSPHKSSTLTHLGVMDDSNLGDNNSIIADSRAEERGEEFDEDVDDDHDDDDDDDDNNNNNNNNGDVKGPRAFSRVDFDIEKIDKDRGNHRTMNDFASQHGGDDDLYNATTQGKKNTKRKHQHLKLGSIVTSFNPSGYAIIPQAALSEAYRHNTNTTTGGSSNNPNNNNNNNNSSVGLEQDNHNTKKNNNNSVTPIPTQSLLLQQMNQSSSSTSLLLPLVNAIPSSNSVNPTQTTLGGMNSKNRNNSKPNNKLLPRDHHLLHDHHHHHRHRDMDTASALEFTIADLTHIDGPITATSALTMTEHLKGKLIHTNVSGVLDDTTSSHLRDNESDLEGESDLDHDMDDRHPGANPADLILTTNSLHNMPLNPAHQQLLLSHHSVHHGQAHRNSISGTPNMTMDRNSNNNTVNVGGVKGNTRTANNINNNNNITDHIITPSHNLRTNVIDSIHTTSNNNLGKNNLHDTHNNNNNNNNNHHVEEDNASVISKAVTTGGNNGINNNHNNNTNSNNNNQPIMASASMTVNFNLRPIQSLPHANKSFSHLGIDGGDVDHLTTTTDIIAPSITAPPSTIMTDNSLHNSSNLTQGDQSNNNIVTTTTSLIHHNVNDNNNNNGDDNNIITTHNNIFNPNQKSSNVIEPLPVSIIGSITHGVESNNATCDNVSPHGVVAVNEVLSAHPSQQQKQQQQEQQQPHQMVTLSIHPPPFQTQSLSPIPSPQHQQPDTEVQPTKLSILDQTLHHAEHYLHLLTTETVQTLDQIKGTINQIGDLLEEQFKNQEQMESIAVLRDLDEKDDKDREEKLHREQQMMTKKGGKRDKRFALKQVKRRKKRDGDKKKA